MCGGCAHDALRLPIRQVISLGCAKVVCPKGVAHFEGAVFESTQCSTDEMFKRATSQTLEHSNVQFFVHAHFPLHKSGVK